MRQGRAKSADYLGECNPGDLSPHKEKFPVNILDSGYTVDIIIPIVDEIIFGTHQQVRFIWGAEENGIYMPMSVPNEELLTYASREKSGVFGAQSVIPNCNAHFFIDSEGGDISGAKFWVEFMEKVRAGGGKNYAYVPRMAYSSAAFIALQADEIVTRKSVSFALHAGKNMGKPSQIVEDKNERFLERFNDWTLQNLVSELIASRSFRAIPILFKIYLAISSSSNERSLFVLTESDLVAIRKIRLERSVSGIKKRLDENASITDSYSAKNLSDLWARAKLPF